MPSGVEVMDLGFLEFREDEYNFDGRFYQPVTPEDYQRRQAAVDVFMQNNEVSNMPIDVHQQWVELDWKEPHGTYKALKRFETKIREECWKETPEASYEYYYSSELSDSDQAALREKLIDELGDTLWLVIASASNSGVNIDTALQEKLWGKGWLSPRVDYLTPGRIDQIIDEGLLPAIGPTDDDDLIENIKIDEMEPKLTLLLRTAALNSLCQQQFAYNEQVLYYSGFIRMSQENIAPMIADLVLITAWYAKHWAHSSLAEVVTANINKVRERVITNTVDREDGPRP